MIIRRLLRSTNRHLVAEAAAAAVVRSDVPARELASFCVHALTTGADIESAPKVENLVDLVWAGLSRRPPASGHGKPEGGLCAVALTVDCGNCS
jgi:hypothetical protein